MRRLALLLAIACVPAFGASAAPTGAEPGATVVDRTVACQTRLSGGIYEVEARAHSGVRESASVWKTLPYAVFVSGEASMDNALVWISAGRPSATTLLEEGHFQSDVSVFGTLGIRLSICRSTRAKVALSTRGLSGGRSGQLGEVVDCATPRTVLVRVRARLESGALRARGDFLRAASPITEAAVAIQARSGRKIAYASVAASGRTRLFTARGCFPD